MPLRRRPLLSVILSVALLAGFIGAGHAAKDTWFGWGGSTGSIDRPAPKSTAEVMIFELEGCLYCDVLRRDVLPRYQASGYARRAPIRFIDINKIDTDGLALRGPLRVVPTTVVMEDGREIDRIVGLTGPDAFMAIVTRLIDQID